jgi:hypothetical protein
MKEMKGAMAYFVVVSWYFLENREEPHIATLRKASLQTEI